MRSEKRDGSGERKTLIACITSTGFLSRVVGKLGREPFASKWSNVVWLWVLEYYTKYRSAPGRQIEPLFEQWCQKNNDKDIKALLERFLSSLSSEYERETRNGELEFVIDQAEKLFNEVLLERLEEELKFKRERGEIEGALNLRDSFKRVDLRTPPSVNILEDSEAQKEALESKQRVLIKYPGMAGEFFGEELSEDSFIAIMAPPKGMKSWIELDLAWRAMIQGNQVAYFQIGDLSKNQIIRRFLKRAVYRPLNKGIVKIPIGITIPIGSYKELAVAEYKEEVFKEDITWKIAQNAFNKRAKKSKGRIRLSYHPIKTISVEGIKNILEGWSREGWQANVIVVDYTYNLAPTDFKANPIDQVSMNYALLRQISETRKCCVITADQSNKEGFKTWCLTRNNFSGSKMVLAHVTAYIGVNQTEEERSNEIIRLNFIVRREDRFSESRCLYAASCLDIGNPIVVSTLPGGAK